MDLVGSAHMKLLQNALKAEMGYPSRRQANQMELTSHISSKTSKVDTAKLKLSKFDLKYSKYSTKVQNKSFGSDASLSDQSDYLDEDSFESGSVRGEMKSMGLNTSQHSAEKFDHISDSLLRNVNGNRTEKESGTAESRSIKGTPIVSKSNTSHSPEMVERRIVFNFMPETEEISSVEDDSSLKTVQTNSSLGLDNIHSIASLDEVGDHVSDPQIDKGRHNTDINLEKYEMKLSDKQTSHFTSPSRDSPIRTTQLTPRKDHSESKSESSAFNLANIRTADDLFSDQVIVEEASLPNSINNIETALAPRATERDIIYDDSFSDRKSTSSLPIELSNSTQENASMKNRDFSKVTENKLLTFPCEPVQQQFSPVQNAVEAESESHHFRESTDTNVQHLEDAEDHHEAGHTSKECVSVAVQTAVSSCKRRSRKTQVALSSDSSLSPSNRSPSPALAFDEVGDSNKNVPVLTTLEIPRTLWSFQGDVAPLQLSSSQKQCISKPDTSETQCCPLDAALAELVNDQLSLTSQLLKRQYRLYLAQCRTVQYLENSLKLERQQTRKKDSTIENKKGRKRKSNHT